MKRIVYKWNCLVKCKDFDNLIDKHITDQELSCYLDWQEDDRITIITLEDEN
jgi:hypothetical protein